ncbi:MAG TPA: DNA polymerase III subunit chi [Usitatibacter sp.]|nr:DNA polymerase III subunit chi [Usitatibacter sp.]
MTRIDFYRYAEDKLRFACRLATKVYQSEKPLVVFSTDRATLQRFDTALWTLQATSFVPHCFAGAAVAAETPIILATGEAELPHHDVLLNLDDEWPPFFASFERVLEIVSTDEEDKQRARARYAFYNKRGYDIQVNAIEGERRTAQ